MILIMIVRDEIFSFFLSLFGICVKSNLLGPEIKNRDFESPWKVLEFNVWSSVWTPIKKTVYLIIF